MSNKVDIEEKGRKEMVSHQLYVTGLFFGLFVFVSTILIMHRTKWGLKDYESDERQQAVQGEAAEHAMLAGVLFSFIAATFLEADLLPVSGGFVLMCVCGLMFTVEAVYTILNGAYFGITGKWKKETIWLVTFGLIEVIPGIIMIAMEGLPQGKLTIYNTNIPMGLMALVVAASVFYQRARDRREEDE
jgi:uncharacterized membrane protein (UPF0136 family)